MYIGRGQRVRSHRSDGAFGKTTYGDVFHQNEVEQSTYNFEYADVDFLFSCFEQYEKRHSSCWRWKNRCRCRPMSAFSKPHTASILRIRTLTKAVAEKRTRLPMCNRNK